MSLNRAPARAPGQSGIVLISCLLTLMVIAVITSVYMMQARGQVAEARGLQEKIRQCTAAREHFDLVVYQLLTRRREVLSGTSASQVSGNDNDTGFWNYYAEPFDYQGSEVRLQDLAGVLSVQDLLFGTGQQIMQGLGVPEDQMRIFRASFRDWQDRDDLYRLDGAERDWYEQRNRPIPRNGNIGSANELRLIRGFPEQLNSFIEQGWLALQPQGFFNPLTAPEPVLSAFLNNSALAAELVSARKERPLSAVEFRNRTGITESESLLMAPSLSLKVQVTARSNQASCRRTFIVNLRGDSSSPYTLEASY
ncbi:hypothetical protein Q667_17640 [Marinobacter sp. C1S70]|uniref:general secretion pathway protein GspK n=1 Tax=Marinobacter sp. C1S70 TaxID=1396859 RepID=UPI0003B8077B|nr:type II secretion system protein GspK [Marinobacter sp. C1S70]ERS85207.1 hypothetical protein Q667_17640 [Marinobacter sp. C1S70]